MRRALVLLLLAAGLGAWLAPGMAWRPLAAAVCPGCFGLERRGPGLAVERGAPEGWAAGLELRLAEGQARALAALGPGGPAPVILACRRADCAERLGLGGARAATLSLPGLAVVLVGPAGAEPVALAHEFAHVRLNALAGLPAVLTGRFPAWLNEGLAVLASDDPLHLAPGFGPARCRAPPEPRIAGPFAFARAARQAPWLYAAAACAALQAEARAGGRAALLDAIGALGWAGRLPRHLEADAPPL